MKYFLAIAYPDLNSERHRDAEAFRLAGVPEHGRGWGLTGPNSRDLDFLYETAEDRAAAVQRFEEHGFTIVSQLRFLPVG